MKDDALLMQVFEGKTPLQVPVIFLGPGCAARIEGTSVGAMRYDANLLYETQRSFTTKTEEDWLTVYSDPLYMAEILGCEVEVLEKGPEITKTRTFDTFSSIESPDFEKVASCKTVLDALAIAAASDVDVPIATLFEGPFTTCMRIFGSDILLYKVIEEPEKVHAALKAVTEVITAYVKLAVERGAEVFCVPDPMSSKNMISPAHYREFAQPYQKAVFDTIHDLGLRVILHICGDTRDRLLDMAATGADGLSLDQIVDLKEAKEQAGANVNICGNVDPINTLFRGSVDDVIANTKLCMEKGGRDHFILMPGCGVPPGSSLENLQAMVETARA